MFKQHTLNKLQSGLLDIYRDMYTVQYEFARGPATATKHVDRNVKIGQVLKLRFLTLRPGWLTRREISHGSSFVPISDTAAVKPQKEFKLFPPLFNPITMKGRGKSGLKVSQD